MTGGWRSPDRSSASARTSQSWHHLTRWESVFDSTATECGLLRGLLHPGRATVGFRGGFGGFVGVAIAARDRAHAAPDVVVDIVRQVGQRDAQRPVGRVETAAVEQHDAVVL